MGVPLGGVEGSSIGSGSDTRMGFICPVGCERLETVWIVERHFGEMRSTEIRWKGGLSRRSLSSMIEYISSRIVSLKIPATHSFLPFSNHEYILEFERKPCAFL